MSNQFIESQSANCASPLINYSEAIAKRGEREAAELLTRESDPLIASVLAEQNPGTADAILWAFSDARRMSGLGPRGALGTRGHGGPFASLSPVAPRALAIDVYRPRLALGLARRVNL